MKKALSLSPRNPEATYYAGIAYSRLGKYKEAEELLLQALQFDTTAVDAYFELGRLLLPHYLTSRCDKAEEFFSRFIALSKEEEMKRYASDLIKSCKEEVKEKPYRIGMTIGYQYDSNVMVEPSNPVVREERKSDFRAVFFLDAGATLFKSQVVQLAVDYNFYQSIQMHLNDFNIHYHQIAPRLEIALSDKVIPSVGYSLEYELMGGDLYARVHTYYGKVTVK